MTNFSKIMKDRWMVPKWWMESPSEQHQNLQESLGAQTGLDRARNDISRVVIEEGSPGLRGRFSLRDHILRDHGLEDLDAEFEQLAVDARCTPPDVDRCLKREPDKKILPSASKNKEEISEAKQRDHPLAQTFVAMHNYIPELISPEVTLRSSEVLFKTGGNALEENQ